jgi:uncharacterized tellurite resistance protein B-like protein
MDEALRHKLCQLVAGIVVTDEDLDPREEAFVDRMLERFGLDASQRDVIFPLVDAEEAAKQMGELPKAAQEDALSLLIDAAVADGKVVSEELEYLRAVSQAVGVDSEELDRRIKAKLP